MTVFIIEGKKFQCVAVSFKNAQLGTPYLVSSPRLNFAGARGARRLTVGVTSANDDDMWTSEKTYEVNDVHVNDDFIVIGKYSGDVILFYDLPGTWDGSFLYQVVSIDGVRLNQ